MRPAKTLFRPNNVQFYLGLKQLNQRNNLTYIQEVAETARITPQHATRLLKLWAEAGLIIRLRSSIYIYTATGKALRKLLLRTEEVLNDKKL